MSEKIETRTWFAFTPCDVVRLRAGYSLVYDDRTMSWDYLANAPEDDCEAADHTASRAAIAAAKAPSSMASVTDTVYLAHPYGGDPRNLKLAKEWRAWLSARYDCEVVAPWIEHCEGPPETAEGRETGLKQDESDCLQCDVAVLGGSRLAPGMRRETRSHPRKVCLYELGLERPPTAHYGRLWIVDALMRNAGIERRR